jgi:hypothetical protein
MVVSVFAPGTQEIKSMQSLECQSNAINKTPEIAGVALYHGSSEKHFSVHW